MEASQLARFRTSLLRWYEQHRRDLPWRRTSDPYAIWVSEIMLQQTRVVTVLDHYERFMQRFPTVVALSLASEDDVLAAWSGMGYYRRARLLHRAAQVVISEHDGHIPQDFETLRRMPGVGFYTAAAVASIAHGAVAAAVDGNVERVLARLEGHSEQRAAVKWQKLALHYLDPQRPGDFNQAMMELGATVCTPKAPQCNQCPLYAWCRTRGEHPVTPHRQIRSVQVAYAVALRKDGRDTRVLLSYRNAESSIMPGMWELPQLPSTPEAEDPALVLRHAITNTNYYVRIFEMEERLLPAKLTGKKGNWFLLEKLPEVPLTGLARKVLRRLGHMSLDLAHRPRSPFREDILEF